MMLEAKCDKERKNEKQNDLKIAQHSFHNAQKNFLKSFKHYFICFSFRYDKFKCNNKNNNCLNFTCT